MVFMAYCDAITFKKEKDKYCLHFAWQGFSV